MSSLLETAKNPPSSYRPVPFWSWNEKIEPEEVIHQVQNMHDAGIGGFFMHARGGLLTEYCGKEWFEAVKTAIEEAEKLGMNPWSYDENGWPSGFGNGKVSGLGPVYQQKYLRLKETDSAELPENLIAVYTPDGKRISPAEAKGKVFAAYYDINPYYVDVLDPKVVAKFIESIHELYNKSLSTQNKRAMTGFFTDEPQISRNGFPWSFCHEPEYQKTYGENLLDVLPGLFKADFPNAGRTRCRYWRLTTRMFMHSFNEQVYNWCREHDWGYTGHMVEEETYNSQLTSNGAVMPHYQYFTIPGMDCLTRTRIPITTTLQLASAAAQMGQDKLLSETFALCGWAVNFADLRWVFQWQMVHGINLLCQHLEGYSLRGIRKRDYPASLFQHQPWWKYYKPLNDEFSRTGVLLADGEIAVDVLVLHGITTAHLFYEGAENNPKVCAYSESFTKLSELLDAYHIQHHYGDETLMEQHGFVKGNTIGIGRMNYKAVVIPELINFSAEQVRQLNEFAANGGILIVQKNTLDSYYSVDGVPTDELPFLQQAKVCSTAIEVVKLLTELCGNLSVGSCKTGTEETAISACTRSFADFDGEPAMMYYYVNNERFESKNTFIRIPAAGLERFNASTGELEPVAFKEENGICELNWTFAPAGSLILIARTRAVQAAERKAEPANLLTLSGECAVADVSENLLTLDHCSCKADGKLLFDKEYVLLIQNKLLAMERDVQTELGFEFETAPDYKPEGPVYLLMEHPENCKITVNGKAVSNVSKGYFADKAFERIEITGALQPGKNAIKLELLFHQDPKTYEGIRASRIFESELNKLTFATEIEAVYLCGNFSVNTAAPFEELPLDAMRCAGPFVIGNRKPSANIENLLGTGYPFFAGEITLRKEIQVQDPKNCAVAFDNVYAVIAAVRVNGQEIAVLDKPDYKAVIPEGLLKQGSNTLEVKLVTSLRNMLGPFHLDEGESHKVCPGSFYKDQYLFRNWFQSKWNPGYCFYKLGVVPAKG